MTKLKIPEKTIKLMGKCSGVFKNKVFIIIYIVAVLVTFLPQIICSLLTFFSGRLTAESFVQKEKELTDIYNLVQEIPQGFKYLWCLLLVGFSIVVVVYNLFLKEKKKIVNIFVLSTMKKMHRQIANREDYMQVNFVETNLISEMNAVGDDYTKIIPIVKQLDIKISEFQRIIKENEEFGFMGIAHTPLIMRVGVALADGINFKLFHKDRESELFSEMGQVEKYPNISTDNSMTPENPKELIVCFSTSFPIVDKDFSSFDLSDKIVLKIEFQGEKGVDAIRGQTQISEYSRVVQSKVKELVKKYDLRKVHYLISSSVAMTYSLGRQLSMTHDVESIVYHYDAKSEIKYPWGISLFKSADEALVDRTKEDSAQI